MQSKLLSIFVRRNVRSTSSSHPLAMSAMAAGTWEVMGLVLGFANLTVNLAVALLSYYKLVN